MLVAPLLEKTVLHRLVSHRTESTIQYRNFRIKPTWMESIDEICWLYLRCAQCKGMKPMSGCLEKQSWLLVRVLHILAEHGLSRLQTTTNTGRGRPLWWSMTRSAVVVALVYAGERHLVGVTFLRR